MNKKKNTYKTNYFVDQQGKKKKSKKKREMATRDIAKMAGREDGERPRIAP